MNDNERSDTFTEQARTVSHLAQEEPQRFNYHDVGTEHVLG
jgi:hypothetical protein